MTDIGEAISRRLRESNPDLWLDLFAPDGSARQAQWEAEDGWIIVYTTERVDRGRWAGRFVTMAYRPTGPGARTGKHTDRTVWVRRYARAFATRKAARARAEVLYYRHSPKRAARDGR